MKRFLLLAPCLILLSRVQAQTDSLYIDNRPRDGITNLNGTVSCQRQIITAEQIRLTGYTKTTDLLQMIDAATFSNFYSNKWDFQLNGTSNYQNENCILMLNGQRIPVKSSISDAITYLGIGIQEIERIEIVNTPDMYLGEYADKGIIHIITKKNYKGFSYRGYMSTGIGKADVTEVTQTQTIGYSNNRLSFNLSAGLLGLNQTAPSPFQTRFDLSYRSKKMLQQLQGNYASPSSYYYSGSGDNLKRGQYNLGYLNHLEINSRNSIRTSINIYSSNLLNYKKAGTSANSSLYYHYVKPFGKDFIRTQVGLAFDYKDNLGIDNNFLPQKNILLYKPFVNLSIPVSRKAWLNSDLQLVNNATNWGFKSTLSIYKRVSIISNWSLVASYCERLLQENNNYVFMSGAYYAIWSGNSHNFTPKAKQFSFDGNYGMNIGTNFKLFLNSGVRYLFNQPYYEINESINDPTEFYRLRDFYFDRKTVNWVNRFYLHYDVLRNVFIDFNYLRTSQLSGDESFMAPIPKNKTTFIINYQLPKKFNLWSRLYYQSATSNWNAYNYENGVYSTPLLLSSHFQWDLGFNRSFYNDQFRVNITFRNLINTKEQYYTYGNLSDFSFLIGIGWNVQQLFASTPAKP